MAIGSTAYRLSIDATKFAEGTALSRRELSFLKTALKETATDADRYKAGLEQLNSLQTKGAITTEQYARAVEKLVEETAPLAEALDVTSPFGKAKEPWYSKLIPTVDVISAARMGLDVIKGGWEMVGQAAAYAAGKVTQQWEAIDNITAAADKLGITAATFQTIAHAANLADVEISSAEKAMEKMLVAISRRESKKMATVFEMLGIDPETLQRAKPDQAMASILQSLEGIGNQADRVRIATQIFGDADIVRLTADGIKDAAERMERFGGALDAVDVERWGRFDEATQQLNAGMESLWKRVAIELTPAISNLAETLDKDLGNTDVQSRIKSLGDILNGMSVAAVEAVPRYEKWADRLTLISKLAVGMSPFIDMDGGGFGELGAAIRRGEELDVKFRELEKKRQEAEGQSLEKDLKLQQVIQEATFMSRPELNPAQGTGSFGGRDVSGYDVSTNEIGIRRLATHIVEKERREDRQRWESIEQKMFGTGGTTLSAIEKNTREKIVVNEIKL